MVRDLLTTLLELLAVVSFVFGVWQIYPPAAFLAFGVILAGVSYIITRPPVVIKDEGTL